MLIFMRSGPPTNPYTGAVENYTGFVPANDFIQDIQLPQQKVLAYDYETEIMWCDIAGSANNATIFASAWLNWARDQGRQVTFNSRCGIAGDFDTPEYAHFLPSASMILKPYQIYNQLRNCRPQVGV